MVRGTASWQQRAAWPCLLQPGGRAASGEGHCCVRQSCRSWALSWRLRHGHVLPEVFWPAQRARHPIKGPCCHLVQEAELWMHPHIKPWQPRLAAQLSGCGQSRLLVPVRESWQRPYVNRGARSKQCDIRRQGDTASWWQTESWTSPGGGCMSASLCQPGQLWAQRPCGGRSCCLLPAEEPSRLAGGHIPTSTGTAVAASAADN